MAYQNSEAIAGVKDSRASPKPSVTHEEMIAQLEAASQQKRDFSNTWLNGSISHENFVAQLALASFRQKPLNKSSKSEESVSHVQLIEQLTKKPSARPRETIKMTMVESISHEGLLEKLAVISPFRRCYNTELFWMIHYMIEHNEFNRKVDEKVGNWLNVNSDHFGHP